MTPRRRRQLHPSRRYHTPTASYRLQLHAGFGFDAARRVVPYLDALGISHLYLSPFFTAAPGSTHGYDVLDHSQVNPELGGLAGLYALADELRSRDMGLIADIVPNHVGLAGGSNPWWRDVLRYGPASHYAPYFDIDWEAQPQMPSGVLVLPVLGKPFGAALEEGELRAEFASGEIGVRYYGSFFPLAPRTYPQVIGLPPLDLRERCTDPAAVAALAEVLDGLTASPEAAARLLQRFASILASEPAIADHVRGCIAALNGEPGVPSSFDRLDSLLALQHYRLMYWRVAGEEINYRRFFDINDLAAIRVERDDVFEEVHRLLFDLVGAGVVTGVRIDHVDGLYDPAAYLEKLQARLAEAAAPHTTQRVPIYVEKVLEGDEPLPPHWPVAGTTGYDFLARADGLFIDPAAGAGMTETYHMFVGTPVRYGDIAYLSRRQIAESSFAGEINVLAMQLHRIAQHHRRHRDNTLRSFREVIAAVLACFPVYRTYVVDGGPGGRDREYIRQAAAEAQRREPSLSDAAMAFLVEVLLLERHDLPDDEQARRLHFRRRFQQVSGPVVAKGIEDTAFYRYNRLVSLNEVGSDPRQFGHHPAAVHSWLGERTRSWPAAMSATSTHDTKRSEDSRARLHALSEFARLWRAETRAWARLNRRHTIDAGGERFPDSNTEYYVYQALVSAWPGRSRLDDAFRERFEGHLLKAIREAKVYTSWTHPGERYEAACLEFGHAILDHRRAGGFLRRLDAFVREIEPTARVNSLGILTLKVFAPGFPDFYQGSELATLALTDPDNRRPIDFDSAAADLADDRPLTWESLAEDGWKVRFARRLLHVRSRRADLFVDGGYEPVEVAGERGAHVFAFARTGASNCLVVAFPRLTAGLLRGVGVPPEAWGDTMLSLPAGYGSWQDELQSAGGCPSPAVGDLFRERPVALLFGQRP